MPTFLQQHHIPAMQLNEKLIDYLVEESKLGRVRQNNLGVAVNLLLSHLHNIALYEAIGTPQTKVDNNIIDTISLLWDGLAP